jgi:hypothetical protein
MALGSADPGPLAAIDAEDEWDDAIFVIDGCGYRDDL